MGKHPFFSLSALVAVCVLASVASAAFTPRNRERLVNVLKNADASNLDHAYSAAAGLHAAGADVPKALCKAAQTADAKSIKDVYFASQLNQLIKGCDAKISGAKKTIEDVLSSGESDAVSLHHAVKAAKTFGFTVNGADIVAKLESIAQSDYSVRAGGYVLDVAASLPLSDEARETFADMSEAIAAQAEVVGNSAKFDGGITATAVVVRGLYAFGAATNKKPDLDDATVRQLVNYFTSGRDTRNVVHAAAVLMGLGAFADNAFHKPAVLSREVASMSSSSPTFQVRVSDALGRPINMQAEIKEVRNAKKQRVGSGVMLTAVGADSTVFSANLASLGLSRGVYTVKVEAAGEGVLSASLQQSVAVTSSAKITDMKVSVLDGSVVAESESMRHPNKLSKALKADDSQAVRVAFRVADESGSAITPHQAVVRLTHAGTGAEVQFAAQQQGDRFIFDLDLQGTAEDVFGSLSGTYKLAVVVGDVTISPAIEWDMGSITITFHKSSPPARKSSRFDPKPEIEHLFREPEARPPVVVSLAFTGVVLAPLLVLFALWIAIGADISNFPWTDVNAFIFHITLGGILLLYATFWLQLNIFDCLLYLTPLAVVLVFSGRNMLRNLATKRVKQA